MEVSVSQAVDDLHRAEWHKLLDRLTTAYAGENATIEVVDAEHGDNLKAERMPLAYLEYDPRNDMAMVAVGGRDGRYPVVLQHMIQHPKALFKDAEPPVLPMALEIVGADDSRTIVTIYPRTTETDKTAEPLVAKSQNVDVKHV